MKTPIVSFSDTLLEVDDFRDEVLRGFAARPKRLPPKFFYDRHGSELFEEICLQPEYYVTRTEIGILRACIPELAHFAGPVPSVLIELGSGASLKIRVLLERLRLRAYVGVDISREFLLQSTRRLAQDYPWIEVHAFCADFSRPITLARLPPGPRLAFYPGSSIGNFEPWEAEAFLRNVCLLLGRRGTLVIGVDLKKDPTLLHAAYNDAAGVTASFNLNLLRRLQRELGADLDASSFRHEAFYNEMEGRIEMHLRTVRPQVVHIADRSFHFTAGERLHTENSYKYTIEEFQALARRACFEPLKVWTDAQSLFSVHYLRVADS
jgi:dimethylhistidine N-methyltransferase